MPPAEVKGTASLGPDRGGDAAYCAPRLALGLSDFELLAVLGEGSMSMVVKALWKEQGTCFAIKIIDKSFLQRNKMTDAVIRERAIMDMLHSDWVVQLRFTFQDDYKLYMGMDLCPNGDLYDQIHARKPLPIDDARFYAAEIVLCLEFIRSHGVVHRDIKPENFLLTEDGHLKLADFGTSKVVEDSSSRAKPGDCAAGGPPGSPLPAAKAPSRSSSADKSANGGVPADRSSSANKGQIGASAAPSRWSRGGKETIKRAVSFVGTADYVAPEILNNTSCTLAVDLWSLGCVVYQLVCGKPPFRDKSEYLTFERVASRSFTYPPDMPADARDLVDKLLVEEPKARLGATRYSDIKEHPFFKGIDWTTIRHQKAPAFHKVVRQDTDADRWELQSLLAALPKSRGN